MSLAETQELMRTMKELMALLNNVQAKTEKIVADTPKVKDSLASFKQLERVSLRYLAIVRRMGLPDALQQQIQLLAQLITTVRMLQISYTMLTSTTPIGVLMGVAGVVLTGFSIYDSMEGY